MEWKIQLKTKGLNQWILEAEQNLTEVRDLLDILETQETQLGSIWKSSAMELWEKEFHLLLIKIRRRLKEMQNLILCLQEAACALAQVEKEMEHSIKGI